MSFIKYIPFKADVSESAPAILCLGNFDGVHIGHTALIAEALSMKFQMRQKGFITKVGAMCFDSLSSNCLKKGSTPQIMSLEEKLKKFASLGLDFAYVCNFNEIRNYSPEEFIENILRKECGCAGVVCGFNYRFGKNAAGSSEELANVFNVWHGIRSFVSVPPVIVENSVVSSSLIRKNIVDGNIESANAMLGRCFSIYHEVVHGKNIGKQLGFPTLNHIFSEGELVPAFGIYATKTRINDTIYTSVTNIGVRPTVSVSDTITCETHLIDFDSAHSSLYGQNAEIMFYSKIREETKFNSFSALSEAIANDIKNTKKYFGM